MPSLLRILATIPAILAIAQGQGLIKSAQGTAGSPASVGLQVDLTKADGNIINKTEIKNNVVNECGRTLLAGNIDIGQTTETALANKTVTSVTKGSKVAVTISKVSTAGAGPYTCDLDLTSNSDGSTGQVPLNVTEVDSDSADIALTVTMPTNMACIGGSTGNVCTVRCINPSEFGGCFAVQQTDITAAVLTPSNIVTSQPLAAMLAQVEENQKGLAVAVKANAQATTDAQQGTLAATALNKLDARDINVSARSGKKGRRGARVFVS